MSWQTTKNSSSSDRNTDHSADEQPSTYSAAYLKQLQEDSQQLRRLLPESPRERLILHHALGRAIVRELVNQATEISPSDPARDTIPLQIFFESLGAACIDLENKTL